MLRPAMMPRRWILATAALALLGGCSSVTGSFVWVDAYSSRGPAKSEQLLIKPGDMIDVRVFNQEQMSGRARVRSDGKVTLPFLNEVDAAGQAPGALAQQLQTKLKTFINAPVVTVAVEEAKPAPVSVMGQVTRPGQYPFENAASVMQALALAGGLTEFAKKDRIFVLRAGPPAERIRFRYDQLQQPRTPAASFRLTGGDVVVVD
jgi:polysaccharide export outer membrane protein